MISRARRCGKMAPVTLGLPRPRPTAGLLVTAEEIPPLPHLPRQDLVFLLHAQVTRSLLTL